MPWTPIGKMTLNENIKNFHNEVRPAILKARSFWHAVTWLCLHHAFTTQDLLDERSSWLVCVICKVSDMLCNKKIARLRQGVNRCKCNINKAASGQGVSCCKRAGGVDRVRPRAVPARHCGQQRSGAADARHGLRRYAAVSHWGADVAGPSHVHLVTAHACCVTCPAFTMLSPYDAYPGIGITMPAYSGVFWSAETCACAARRR